MNMVDFSNLQRYNAGVRVLTVHSDNHLIDELEKIGVDPHAYTIFVEKSHCQILKMDKLSCAQANVLKQTALLCGADAAIPKFTYAGGRTKNVSVLVFANNRELHRMRQRLAEQKWLMPIVHELDQHINTTTRLTISAGRFRMRYSRTLIMGIINVTPDSFYPNSRYRDPGNIRAIVHEMEAAGVDLIDVGAESSRPGAAPTPIKTEIERLEKVLPIIAKTTKKPISIDTYKSKVASYAIEHGACIVNEISALRFDKNMARCVAKNKAGIILMHMKGTPRTMQRNPRYKDLMAELHSFFQERIAFAQRSGIDRANIIIDPGLGFGKRLQDNYHIINRLHELSIFQRPICVGHSRKSFIGRPANLPPDERLEGTLGMTSLLIRNGAHILRVHDVKEVKRVAFLTDTVLS